MRILAIGLGGAGSRIVDQLYCTDRRSKIPCVQALAVDIDADSLSRLACLPDTAKLCFPPLDLPAPEPGAGESATIDPAEVAARVQTLATGETDAIVFCMGLGGGMADAAPHLIAALRSSVTEPIFALVTLPCLSEGEFISSKAADDIEMIAPLLDGVIIFDNETWHNSLKAKQKTLETPEQGIGTIFGLKKRKEQAGSPAERMYSLLNDAIVRRISLILRAGEFKADGGIDLAEVVLDAGEVLNTMRGMGFITIGYAVERLPSRSLDVLGWLRPPGLFSDDSHKKASRIIDLAKQAIYHEISAPCDITSAHKALILIAGPTHELSMKGFMTVRKWIDRSIAGLETRSGDYPITSTKYIAIIIMLSGLENIPRIGELKAIRAQYRARLPERAQAALAQSPAHDLPATGLRDEMIAVPGGGKGQSAEQKPASAGMAVAPAPPSEDRAAPRDAGQSEIPRGHISRLKTSGGDAQADHQVQAIKKIRIPPPRPQAAGRYEPVSSDEERQRVGTSEQERKRIERELQKQRKLAILGTSAKERELGDREPAPPPHERPETESPKKMLPVESSPPRQVILKKHVLKTVIIHKKSQQKGRDEPAEGVQEEPPRMKRGGVHRDEPPTPETDAGREEFEQLDTWIRQVAEQKKDPREREAPPIYIDEGVAPARDDALLHTDLKRQRQAPEPGAEERPVSGRRSKHQENE